MLEMEYVIIKNEETLISSPNFYSVYNQAHFIFSILGYVAYSICYRLLLVGGWIFKKWWVWFDSLLDQ
jgi:hypothetical protein